MSQAAIIGLSIPAIAGCMSAIFLSFWYYNRKDQAALSFAAAFLMCVIGFTLNHYVLEKGSLANAALNNGAYAIGITLLVHGACLAFQRRTPWATMGALGVSSVVCALAIQQMSGDLGLRILVLNMIHGSMLTIGTLRLWGISRHSWSGTAVLSAYSLCIVNFTVISTATVYGRLITADTFFASAYWLTMTMLSTLSVIAVGGALISVCVMQRLRAVRDDADHDFLTGLKTRRAFEDSVERFCDGRNGDTAATLILVDLDHFKRINDRLGHTAGDEVIRSFGNFLTRQTRRADIAGRVGGEEFCLLLPGTGTSGARRLAARLRNALTTLEVSALPEGEKITASFGIAEFGRVTSFSEVYSTADCALYAAKARGRDRIVCAEPPADAGTPLSRQRFASTDAEVTPLNKHNAA
ncbi:GGDEF domain-containing protein [Henriciella litoralis]|uniref:GGDEF domain-containing protein n=1 Tax=Henriciella litoralis TaxID=568102 RepID=UPI00111C6DB9|nr:GGDEF domain-containing protein [Henriciella litoralis]